MTEKNRKICVFRTKKENLLQLWRKRFAKFVKETVFLSRDKTRVFFLNRLDKNLTLIVKRFKIMASGLCLNYQNNVLRVHRNDWRTTFFERKSDSKGFSYLTEEVWTTLSKPLSTCPEDYCDSVFKKSLIQVFRSGSEWFQIFGKKLGAVLSKVHSICQWYCFEVFLIKEQEVWSIISPDFQTVETQKSYRNWNLQVKSYNSGNFTFLRKRNSVTYCWTWCKFFNRAVEGPLFASTGTC